MAKVYLFERTFPGFGYDEQETITTLVAIATSPEQAQEFHKKIQKEERLLRRLVLSKHKDRWMAPAVRIREFETDAYEGFQKPKGWRWPWE
jgi:hypothetical protein